MDKMNKNNLSPVVSFFYLHSFSISIHGHRSRTTSRISQATISSISQAKGETNHFSSSSIESQRQKVGVTKTREITKSLTESEKKNAPNCKNFFFSVSLLFFFLFSFLSMDQIFLKDPKLKSLFNKNLHFDYKPMHSTFVYDKFIKDFDKAISR